MLRYLELDDLIRQGQPAPDFPASFQREIWARIAVAEQATLASRWERWIENFFGTLARPAPAFVVVTVMLLAGVSLGHLLPDDGASRASREAYLASINPLRTENADPME